MALKKYLCTHCGKHFEAEEREIIECPGCFWSTSVKPDTGSAASQVKTSPPIAKTTPLASPVSLNLSAASFNLGKAAKVFAAAAVILLVFFLGMFLIRSGIFSKPKSSGTDISAADLAAADSLGKTNSGGTAEEKKVITPEDQAVLSSKAALEETSEPSAEMAKLLSREAPFQSGSVQTLPSKSWTEETFSKMLAEQEMAYKVTFPRSYRGKIMELFKTQYLPGSAAFEAGDLLGARNNWVSSLAFPLYSQDPMRHRGVALTILRPFINDTLSKIGALNTMLVEAQLRSREEEISRDYQAVRSLIAERSWAEALKMAGKLQAKISGFEQSVTPESSAPPYPETVRQIDRDIGATLMDILTPPTPPMGNLVPLSEDLKTKMSVLEMLLPENRQEQVKFYEEGLSRIQSGDYEGAAQWLGKVRFPKSLAEDAAQKVAILQKIQQSKS